MQYLQEFWLLAGQPTAFVLAVTAAAGLAGGLVRGYSGFGFALAAIPILTLVMPPVAAIPAVLPIELAIGLATLPTEHKWIAWRPCIYLIMGTLVGTPLGLTILASMPAEPMRIAIGVLVVFAAAILWRRPAFLDTASRPLSLAGAGFVSGLLNGGTAMGAPPAVIALLGSNLQSHVARATLIAFIAVGAGLGLSIAVSRSLLTPQIAIVSALMLPSAALGGAIGLAAFSRTSRSHYRTASLVLLVMVSVLAMMSAALALL